MHELYRMLYSCMKYYLITENNITFITLYVQILCLVINIVKKTDSMTHYRNKFTSMCESVGDLHFELVKIISEENIES